MYGAVPTHPYHCRKVRSYPTTCEHCGKRVIYFECTCGSKIFLEENRGEEPHDCRKKDHRQRMAIEISELIERASGTAAECPLCHSMINIKKLPRHVRSKCPARPKFL